MTSHSEEQTERKQIVGDADAPNIYPNLQETKWSFQAPQDSGMDGEKATAVRNGGPDLAAVGRDRWSGRLDFLLSCVGFAVGLGNVWRFPYLCYKNGGGAFLIPYFICAFFGGIPLFFLEAALGQYTSLGGIKAWKICPLFQGIGIAASVICWWCNVYYIVILAWALYYLVNSFTSDLPWAHCGHSWNTEFCVEYESNFTCVNETVFSNGSLIVVEEMVAGTNYTCAEFHRTTAVGEFWENQVLQLSSGVDEMGSVVWHLALSLLVAWILCYFCIWKGVKWTGKIVYFTATFPYVILTALLIRGVTLPGAADGLLFYVKPDLSRLADGQVWMDSGTQIFYSYAIGLGACISLGSYNKYHHNVYRDSMILAGMNSFTSLYGGIAIFSVLGYMSHEQNVPIEDVASKGPGLAFIAYPRAVALMPLAPLWAVLFFIMILMVGLDSEFVGVEGFVTAIGDLFPTWMRRPYHRELFVLVVCIISYFVGLVMVMQGGMYVFQIFDAYAVSGIALLWIAFFEGITVSWFYGANRFYDNLVDMIGYRPFPWFKYCWMVSLPGITLAIASGVMLCGAARRWGIQAGAIWIFSIVTWGPMTYDDYEYPRWAEGLGFCLALSSMVWIPGFMIYQITTVDGPLLERIKFLMEPSISPQSDDYAAANEMEKFG